MNRDQLADWLHCLEGGMYDWVIDEIQKELAKPKQEPVAWQVMVENESMKEFSIKEVAHDWAATEKRNGSKYSYWFRPLYALGEFDAIVRLKQALAQPEHPLDKKADNARDLGLDYEPVGNEKVGSPCPEFWDWLPKAYNFWGSRTFSRYNMEVAFLAGKNTALAQPEQKPVAWLYNGHLHECDPSDWAENEVKPLYAAPPRKPWVGLTSEDWENTPDTGKQGCERDCEIFDWIEQTLKDKNDV